MNEEELLNLTFDMLTHDRLAEYDSTNDDSINDDFTEIQDGNNFYLIPKPNFLSSDEILYKVFCTSN